MVKKKAEYMDVIGLVRKKLVFVSLAGAGAAVLAVYFVFFAPLAKKLHSAYLECRDIENEVFEIRNVIDSAGKIYGDRVLMTEKDVTYAIDELTRHGSSKGINFISMSPLTIRTEKVRGAQYKILPVEMELESNYQQLGVALGELDDLEKGLVKVKSFEIKPDGHDSSKFITHLVVDIYLSARGNQEEELV